LTNESVILNTTFTNNEVPIVNGKSVVYLSEKTKIDSLELFDDGTHNDFKINDGIYGNKIIGFKSIGFYNVIVKAKFQEESIYDEHLITVYDNTAEFTNTFKEQVLDKNADKLYDSLQIKVGFKVKTTGNFMVSGSLKDSKGTLIGTASWSNSKTKPLVVGVTYEAVLNFNGESVSKNGANGPYILDDLILMDITNNSVVDSRKKAYTTKFYDVLFFSRPPIELTGKNSETPIDSDKDGDFDFLDIKIQANVTQAGTYSMSAELIDSLQNSLNWAQNSVSLKAGLNDITLRFSGDGINEKLANGPYTLTNLYFNGSVVSVTFYDVYKTNKYKFSDFTGNIITGTLKDKFSNALVTDATIILKGTKLVTVKTDSKGLFTIAGLPNGAYTLEAQKLNFCSSPISTIASLKSSITIDLFVINKKISISDKKTQQICKGDSIVLNLPTGWTSYKWVNGNTNSKIVVKNNGVFSATVSSQTCQASTDTVTITVIDPPKPTISSDGVVNLKSSVSENYQWLFNGQIINGATSQSYIANASGKYSVRGSLKGCFNTSDELTLIITAIEEETNPSEIQVEVSPNPTQEVCRVKIDFLKPSKVTLQLRDISGRNLQEQTLSNSNKHHETTLDFSKYADGVYLLRVSDTEEKSVVKKIIKQH
jgi:Secretion system C-terminal sorting domain/Carboxypeptidase regulatory-like domain